jgi:hypothetical protein
MICVEKGISQGMEGGMRHIGTLAPCIIILSVLSIDMSVVLRQGSMTLGGLEKE